MNLVRLALLLVLLSCSGASAATHTAYALEEARCVNNERQIVNRTGHTLEEDQHDLALERARCDAALRALRGAP